MIEGLQYDVKGSEVISLMEKKIELNKKKAVEAEGYRKALEAQRNLLGEQGYLSKSSEFENNARSFLNEANELAFMKAHILPDETYRLSSGDLHTLGITSSRF